MVSVAVNSERQLVALRNEAIRQLIDREEHLLRWVEQPAGAIIHHEASCCEEARLWFLAYARSMEIGVLSQYNMKAPTWFSQRYRWGPSKWPISWCQVIKAKVLDCAVFAALAREVFAAQGHSAYPAQALLSYNATCTSHWKALWKMNSESKAKGRGVGEVFPWIGNEVVYHELCVLELPDGECKFFDSTWGTWYVPQQRIGYGALLALRTECPRLLRWGGKTFSCGEWVNL